MELFATIQKVLGEHFRKQQAEISRDTRLREDLGADSLDYADLMMAFEDAFQIDVKDEDFEGMETVSDIEAYITALYKSK